MEESEDSPTQQMKHISKNSKSIKKSKKDKKKKSKHDGGGNKRKARDIDDIKNYFEDQAESSDDYQDEGNTKVIYNKEDFYYKDDDLKRKNVAMSSKI